MLDEGLRLGLEHVGYESRVVAYVEREAYAQAVLLARMADATLEPAPICDSLEGIDARFRGHVDCVVAGFPCQPWSTAGLQAGIDDERWLWPEIARIIGDVQPGMVFLENVPGLVSGGGLNRVLNDLAALGYDAEWACLSAAEVGASHRRERVFILANSVCERQRKKRQRTSGSHASVGGGELAHDQSNGRKPLGTEPTGQQRSAITGDDERPMDDARCDRAGEPRQPCESDGQERRGPVEFSGRRFGVGHANGARLQINGYSSSSSTRRERLHTTPERASGKPLFAPGPSDPRWPAIFDDAPHLAPAIKPGVRMLGDGLSLVVDESRADQLRCAGNGVVPFQAAAAFVGLFCRLTQEPPK